MSRVVDSAASTGNGPEALGEHDAHGATAAFLERHEGLVVTHWFDPAVHDVRGAITVRFSGRRIGTSGSADRGDGFVHDETVEDVTPQDGPISVTARVTGVNPGEWTVSAALLLSSSPRNAKKSGRFTKALRETTLLPRATWSWRRWKLGEARDDPVSTCLMPLARIPGLVRGLYGALAVTAMALGLAVQQILSQPVRLGTDHSLFVSLIGLAAGLVGAKAWFVAGHLRDGRKEGWCIQGLVAGFTATALVATATTGLRLGAYLDVSAPGLLFGMAIGRLGCFFAGCCRGRPSRSRFAIWSSDQRIGRRRIPTQLMESALALSAAGAALAVVLVRGPANGALFVATVAGYTLVRQGILRLRAERESSPWLALLVTGTAVAALTAAILAATL